MKVNYDVVIIGGSYAGLSAAMALGRSLRSVLIIDSGKPCNRQTPHSHNFLTRDGETPAFIAGKAMEQVLQYKTVEFVHDKAILASRLDHGFKLETELGISVTAKKLLFATGVHDQMPVIDGFADCWGISVLHCPYCHGYEVHDQRIGILGNSDPGFELTKLIDNWTKDLMLLTNGRSVLNPAQEEKIKGKKIPIIEQEIRSLEHENGYVKNVVFMDGSKLPLTAIFSRVPFVQHCAIPMELGCGLNDAGFIQVDDFQRTTVTGIFAAGDNTTMARSVSVAVAAGTKAGSFINKELIEESF